MQIRFEQVAAKLHQALPAARIEHVGSSAIPGAISKGDLDICVVVAPNQFDAICAQLKSLGYAEKQDTLRTSELCMLLPVDNPDDHALQLVAQGSKFEFFMTFRDALIANAALVEEYNAVKTQAIALGEKAYREAKSRFIDRVLAEK